MPATVNCQLDGLDLSVSDGLSRSGMAAHRGWYHSLGCVSVEKGLVLAGALIYLSALAGGYNVIGLRFLLAWLLHSGALGS